MPRRRRPPLIRRRQLQRKMATQKPQMAADEREKRGAAWGGNRHRATSSQDAKTLHVGDARLKDPNSNEHQKGADERECAGGGCHVGPDHRLAYTPPPSNAVIHLVGSVLVPN